MDRFLIDHEKLNKEKANDIYLDCCKGIIEQNGLKDKAKEISLKMIDMIIEDEKPKDKLTSFYWTALKIKEEIKAI